MKKELKEINKRLNKKIWKYLNKTMEVKYMALWFLIIIIVALTLHNVGLRTRNVYVWWTPEESGLSNYCYEKKEIGKVCLTEKKVNQFEKSRKEVK